MRLTRKLIGFLNRVFDKDPHRFLAIRINYDGSMEWQLADGILTTNVSGGSGANLAIDVRQYTIAGLATHISGLPGYSIPFVELAENSALSARCLMDASGNQAQSNGDHIYAYTSPLWAYMDANAAELAIARTQVTEMLKQMSTRTAENEWLDELGSYYAVPRNPGESDALYGPRIIATVLRPRGNNIAIATAIEEISNGLRARIVDAVDVAEIANLRDGTISFNGAYRHFSGDAEISHNLFDAQFDVDFTATSGFDGARIAALIDLFRDAGTHLRRISMTGAIVESAPSSEWTEEYGSEAALDGFVDAFTPAEARTHDGAILRDGTSVYDNGSEELEFEVIE